eukprot:310286-Rhodomonas_salina.4
MAFDAGQSLLKVQPPQRSPVLLAAVARYLPLMRLRFGADDADVKDIAAAIDGACVSPEL